MICPDLGSVVARYLSAPKSQAKDEVVTSQMLGMLSLFAFFVTVLILPLPQITDLVQVMVILGLVLIILGAIMPLLSGVFLCAVPASHRVVACSLSSAISLVFGHAPSTLIYGMVSSTSNKQDSEH